MPHLGHHTPPARARRQTALGEGRARACTTSIKDLRRRAARGDGDATADELAELELARPRTRGECEGGIRPCPFVACRYHLAAEVTYAGGLKLAHGRAELDELQDTCSLDVADRGGLTLEEVAIRLNLTRERVRQIETRALLRLSSGVA